MTSPVVKSLLNEFGLELSDVRWYLCVQLGIKLLALGQEPDHLTRFIWSGELEAEVYRVEERFLEELSQNYDAGNLDEARLRELCSEIKISKRRRAKT